jgi:ATP-NAD kinase N-terminal domain
VNRVELDRQHLVDVDLMLAVGGDGTVLSAAHFLDHGTIPLLGVNSDPNTTIEHITVKDRVRDERRSHGALCMCTALNMHQLLPRVIYGDFNTDDDNDDTEDSRETDSTDHNHATPKDPKIVLQSRTRIRCKVKSTFSETLLVPALNDLLITNPSPAAVSRFRIGWLEEVPLSSSKVKHTAPPPSPVNLDDYENEVHSTNSSHTVPSPPPANASTAAATPSAPSGLIPSPTYGTITRFGRKAFNVHGSLNVWSSGMWICSGTGSTAAMAAAGGDPMTTTTKDLQYLIREHMLENAAASTSSFVKPDGTVDIKPDHAYIKHNEKMLVRWNSQKGRIFIDGSHLSHSLELGDEILVDNQAPQLQLFTLLKN